MHDFWVAGFVDVETRIGHPRVTLAICPDFVDGVGAADDSVAEASFNFGPDLRQDGGTSAQSETPGSNDGDDEMVADTYTGLPQEFGRDRGASLNDPTHAGTQTP